MTGTPLRILFASPAYWPARAFGGPVAVMRELAQRLVERGHTVEVLTTTLVDLHQRPAARSSRATVDGATVRYVGTPLHYRWMGITPSLPVELYRLARRAPPDVVHVFGFRDPITTVTSAWCRARGIPYVLEPLGMFRARLRKVGLKRALDSSLFRHVPAGAAALIAASELEADDFTAGGVPPERIVVRGNGFPDPDAMPDRSGRLRRRLGIPPDAPVALYVGRIAAGKGVEHLLEAARRLPTVHVVVVGPDDGHGVGALVRAAQAEQALRGRVHALPPEPEPPLDLYPDADVLVLASSGESFGMVAAEAAATGTPLVLTPHVGMAGFLREDEALIVPDDRDAVVDAIRRVLFEAGLGARLSDGGRAAARRLSWERVVDLQEEIYRLVASRTAVTKLSTDAS